MKVTKDLINRFKKDCENIAKEELQIEFNGNDGIFYLFGSELATLRLLKAYRKNESARAEESVNLNTFVFSLGSNNLIQK